MGVLSTLSSRRELPFLEWKRGIAAQRRRQTVIVMVMVVLVCLAAWRCDINMKSLTGGISKGASLIWLFLPPDWSALPELMKPVAQTAVIAMIATILGMCLSLPCALAASSNLSPAPLRHTARAFIALERGLPEIVQMLLLIAIFGLGAVPGLIALSISSIGMLAKLLADSIEEIELHTLEAVEGTGATRSQLIRYAVIPQILPALLANGLFRFEVNVRAGVILGAIGAGGIGYEMSTSMASMDLRRASMATLLTLALVFSAERISEFLRERVLGKGALLR
jgi:phosphonate transport system permease protein